MAIIFKDRAKETSTSTGMYGLTLLGAPAGFAALPTADDFYYCIVNTEVGVDEWEVGQGYSDGTSLGRSTIIDGTSGNSRVNFSAGTKDIFCTLPAQMGQNLLSAYLTAVPNARGTTSTSDATPTAVTLDFAPALPAVGGVQYTSIRYSVVAFDYVGSETSKAWEGKIVYAAADGATDSNSVTYNPDSKAWAITVSFVSDVFTVTVTGDATDSLEWLVSATADICRQTGA